MPVISIRRAASFLGMLAVVTAAEFTVPPCESPREVRDFLQHPPEDDASKPYEERLREEISRLDTMLAKFPRDLSLHQRRRALSGGPMRRDWKAPAEIYRMLRDEHGGDPLYEFLYAKAITGTRTAEAIRIHESLVARYPAFGAPHLELAGIRQMRGPFRDLEKSFENREAYRKVCPEALNGFAAAFSVNDQTYFERGAQQLRKLLEAAADDDAARLTAYETLWRMEFRGRPASGHDALRVRVEADMKRLRALTPERPTIAWIRLLQSGYRMSNQGAQADALGDMIQKTYPDSRVSMQETEGAFHKKHPFPRTANQQDEADWARQLLSASSEWIRRWPGAASPYAARLSAIDMGASVTPADVEQTADRLLENYGKQPDEFRSLPPLAYRIATVYLKHGVRLDRIPSLIEQGTAELAESRERDQAEDTVAPGERGDGSYGIWLTDGAPIAIVSYLRRGQTGPARRLLTEMDSYVLENPDRGEDAKSQTNHRNGILAEMRGRVAEAENRPADAVALYVRAAALQASPPRAGRPHRIDAGLRARELWKNQGGTAEGLQALREAGGGEPGADSKRWTKSARVLPDFEITDTAGKTWRMKDLRTKRVFVNLWATWCGFCHPELPEVQKLHEELRNREDAVVLTFNLDDNPGLVAPYLKEKGYTFPVLPALPLIERMGVELSIPRNWIAGPGGKVLWEQLGYSFEGPPSDWLRKRALELLSAAQ